MSVTSEGEAVSECGAQPGNAFETEHLGYGGVAFGAVSSDGLQVVFSAPDPAAKNAHGSEGCWNAAEETQGKLPRNPPQLYVRLEGQPGVSETIEVSEPEKGVSPAVTYPAFYAGAAEDGSRVFFATRTALTTEVATLKLDDLEMYEWRRQGVLGAGGPCEHAQGCLARVSIGQPGTSGRENGAEVTHVLTIASGGSAIYFSARKALATGGSNSSDEFGEAYQL